MPDIGAAIRQKRAYAHNSKNREDDRGQAVVGFALGSCHRLDFLAVSSTIPGQRFPHIKLDEPACRTDVMIEVRPIRRRHRYPIVDPRLRNTVDLSRSAFCTYFTLYIA